MLSIGPSRVSTPQSIPQPTGLLPSAVGTEAPRDGSGIQPEEQELVLDSPFVPTHPRRKQHLPSMVPSSAPPRIGDAPVFDAQQKRQILPFQVQYAEQLERRIHTGPIVAPIRTKLQRPQVQVVIEDTEPVEHALKSSTSIIGSDIVRFQSSRTVSTERPHPSPLNITPSDYTNSRIWHDTPAITPTTVCDLTLSMPVTPGPLTSVSPSSRDVLSAAPSRSQSTAWKVRSLAEASAKSAWRPPIPRQSYSSAKTFGAREELQTVREGQPSGPRRASRVSNFTNRRVGVARPQSLKSTRRPSPQLSRMGKALPPIPIPAAAPPPQYLVVPDHLRSPTGPDSPSESSIRPSSQYVVASPTAAASPLSGYAYERAQGSGRLRGPRTPPASSTTPTVLSEWPVPPGMSFRDSVRMDSGGWRRRSGSCPELPPLDITLAMLRSVDSPQTPY